MVIFFYSCAREVYPGSTLLCFREYVKGISLRVLTGEEAR